MEPNLTLFLVGIVFGGGFAVGNLIVGGIVSLLKR
jgi:uncharacterized membrane protein YciS (DUF1049 family)